MSNTPPYKINPELVFVTPQQASAWLQKMPEGKNRSVADDQVARMAYDMSNNMYALTHEGIGLHPDNWPFDGQHRLTAIVKSGQGQWLFVFRYDHAGYAAAMPVLNTGRKRGLADAIRFSAGWGSPRIVAAGRLIAVLEHGNVLSDQVVKEICFNNLIHLEWMEKHLGSFANSAYGAAFAYCRPIAPVEIEVAIMRFVTGVGAIDEHDPMLTLHNRVLKGDPAQKRIMGSTAQRKAFFRVACAAIMKHHDGLLEGKRTQDSVAGLRWASKRRAAIGLSVPRELELESDRASPIKPT